MSTRLAYSLAPFRKFHLTVATSSCRFNIVSGFFPFLARYVLTMSSKAFFGRESPAIWFTLSRVL